MELTKQAISNIRLTCVQNKYYIAQEVDDLLDDLSESADRLQQKAQEQSRLSDPEREELMRELDRRLAELPGKLRRALVLAEFEGLEYEEIARIERTRVGTIKSRIHRARSRLRTGLERFTGDTT